jgi:ribosomal protein L11 methyltransferase
LDLIALKRDIIAMVEEGCSKITAGDLERIIAQRYLLRRRDVRSVVKDLVADQRLVYTYHFGCSFIEKSFNRAVRISRHVVLKPPHFFFRPGPGDIVVTLLHGAAFGTGQHPSTRLAVKAIEYAVRQTDWLPKKAETQLLDIGTGSGILAITGLKLGVGRAIGLDNDPCALSEAITNVRLNGLTDRVEISNRPLNHFHQKFILITANLRYPTLLKMRQRIACMTKQHGAVILSGIKTDEIPAILNGYTDGPFECDWQVHEKGWSGLVLSKRR